MLLWEEKQNQEGQNDHSSNNPVVWTPPRLTLGPEDAAGADGASASAACLRWRW